MNNVIGTEGSWNYIIIILPMQQVIVQQNVKFKAPLSYIMIKGGGGGGSLGSII